MEIRKLTVYKFQLDTNVRKREREREREREITTIFAENIFPKLSNLFTFSCPSENSTHDSHGSVRPMLFSRVS